ncbi:MAG: hypothetical protein AAB866_03055 [Patescibacteria group bacterium]
MSSRILEERLEKIISFVVEGLTRKEIGKRLGLNYHLLETYLYRHPEIPKPAKKESGRPNGTYNLEKYNLIKKLIRGGSNQSEIAIRRGISRQAISDYLNNHPELQSPAEVKYKKIKELIKRGLNKSEMKGIYEDIYRYIFRHPELRKIYEQNRKDKK